MNHLSHISFSAALLFAALPAGVYGQSVIYPDEMQPGVASLSVENVDSKQKYELGNDLLTAAFESAGNKLFFMGCKEMNLAAGTELFTVRLGNGTAVAASEMTLKDVRIADLTGDPDAARGSERIDGKALEADFSYGGLDILWRAVLRDGSHYLRTEMEITANTPTAMNSIVPMIYTVEPAEGVTMPVVVGNTRGAILAGSRIFAGVESPMGINTVGGADVDNSNFTHDSWTPESFSWTPGDDTPAGVTSLGFSNTQIVGTRGNLEFGESGSYRITFSYTSGTHRLNIAGVDIVNPDNGSVVASDYHVGYTGNAASGNTYTLNVPEAGTYLLRIFCETKTETITSSGSISYDKKVSVPEVISGSDQEEVNIVGTWSRNTTLAAGNTWTISAVVGLIAPGQARRSVLAYSERERAVPWRPFPIYNSWYELNIDRNNAAPPSYKGNMTVDQCVDVVAQWRQHLYEEHDANISAFVWDDGWDSYGTWTFNPNFPNGFTEPNEAAMAMNTGIGTWLGPVGGYGTSGTYRRNYWTNKGGMQLSNPAYYDVFLTSCSNMINDYDFRYFKFDGISAQFSSVGPDSGTTGEENAEGIINLEQQVRKIKPDIFLNTTVGTWASPFWFRFTDAVWRQEADFGTIGDQGTDRERWITYRDRLVYQNFVQNSPLCPINTMMTHGVILTKFGAVAKNMNYEGVLRELRCAFACGSGMVELYCDYSHLNGINGGKLWGDIAECIKWQQKNADVLPDIHWVGGNPWDGTKANVYGWASWNGPKATLALRNPAASDKEFTFTLREALDIPAYVSAPIILEQSFEVQDELEGLTLGEPIDLDTQLTVKLPGSSLFVFDGSDSSTQVSIAPVEAEATAKAPAGTYDLLGRKVDAPTRGLYIIDGRKTLLH